ncbi:ferredoxin-thioredoxin reductase catalytic chain [Bathycoccus prasinos]|uniref:Ferredoxin-thioredoxin reductase catalytic chain, chloroplastic n=1 Tax=Bathycoccus prasinos TaxID=41875 RepID=K8F1R7_9CHLO|nr:ferredoxin-thioredoxin reductase catalytic chain [Bathycoccus prasinos]CCO66040.1 ferredoxin-thioredoxin reductase catalytic chain [Bathycoccus prasinos]|eukprot:XP_007511952.1 ferredoxin-thioredoxin reductase catalytic chain [Bathycoccus prasinos]
MSFAISQTSLTARSSSAFTSSVRVNRATRMASRHSSSSSKVSLVTKCEGPTAKNLEIMRKFSEQYARSSGTKFCMDKSVTAVVIQGLAEHKDTLGSPLCPCRHYDDKEAEVKAGFWNCPCIPMRERKECHCMLFLTDDNDFAGDDSTITIEEINEAIEDM